MVALSQELAAFKAPLAGMDVRNLSSPTSPSLLFNIDLSLDGSWRDRPGLTLVRERPGTEAPILGLHVFQFHGESFVVVIRPVIAGTISIPSVYIYKDAIGPDGEMPFVTGAIPLGGDTYNGGPRGNFYDFAQAGRFLYFSNGVGHYYELEWLGGDAVSSFTLRSSFLEPGIAPDASSYLLGQMKPSSLEFFYDQIVVSGFKKDRGVALSNPLAPKQTEVPEELLSLSRDVLTTTPGHIFVAEPSLWRSFPLEDAGGVYWFFNEDIVATSNFRDTILVFTEKSLYRIVGHGTATPRREWLADVSLVSARAITRLEAFVFFVGQDGCYITDGASATKVSEEMDPLWRSQYRPQVTRKAQRELRRTAYPFYVNRRALDGALCINDRERKQIMVSLPSSGFAENNMVWVWNYEHFLTEQGPGRWTVWAGKEEPLDTNPGVILPNAGPAFGVAGTNTRLNGATSVSAWHVTSMAVSRGISGDTIYIGSSEGHIYTLGGRTDSLSLRDFAPKQDYLPLPTGYPLLISLGRTGRVDPDGRTVYTDVAIRHLQEARNLEDDTSVNQTTVIVRSEGDAQRLINANNDDVEDEKTTPNMQYGVSEKTMSVMGNAANAAMVLGDTPTGTASPLLSSEYTESYARINAPDEEARTVMVDIYRPTIAAPQRFSVTEVRLYGAVKGGSQRNQS
jgi:hypothetical protein